MRVATIVTATTLLLFAANAQARKLKGHYRVPVESGLESNAIFPVELEEAEYDKGGPAKLDFPLPIELTGNPTTIQMARVGDTREWKGEKVSGACDVVDRLFSCEVRFTGLTFDKASAAKVIDTKFADPIEAARRLKVMESFSDEPHGFIVYRLRGRDRDKKGR